MRTAEAAGSLTARANVSSEATVDRAVNEARVSAFGLSFSIALGTGISVGFDSGVLIGIVAGVVTAGVSAGSLAAVYRGGAGASARDGADASDHRAVSAQREITRLRRYSLECRLSPRNVC